MYFKGLHPSEQEAHRMGYNVLKHIILDLKLVSLKIEKSYTSMTKW